MIDHIINSLIAYALREGILDPVDAIWATNALLERLQLDSIARTEPPYETDLPAMLEALTDDAVRRGLVEDDITHRDLFDTGLMGCLTPPPSVVQKKFFALYDKDPREATDYFYKLSGDVNYIRRDRIAKNLCWKAPTEYGDLDITVNLSKPEKDPRAIAAAKLLPQTDYPKCQLCAENEGYAGRLNHPGRSNHRLVPLKIAGEDWFFQYSPYVYYNEHCIVFNSRHIPMKVDRAAFEKLFSFLSQFPHYFVGSNADLPIVGGSILSHDHFQGGHYEFAMARAEAEEEYRFRDFPEVSAGIVRWPMSVLRLRGSDPKRVIDLAERVLNHWRGYSDESVFVLAETDGVPHNTITPIGRRRGEDYELDLVLRNNITTDEFPLGVYHPHQELHHIKKENIGLIEVMGLAVLPARLLTELEALKQAMLSGADLRADERTASHADWAEEIMARRPFSEENAEQVLREEVGVVFEKVLEDAGVFKRDEKGRAAFRRFLDSVNG